MAATDTILGPLLLGLILNGILFGALLVQYYIYWMTGWKRDPVGIKIVVSFLLLADTISFAFDLGFVWLYLVTHFGDFQYIRRSEWVFNTEPVMTAIISSTVQCFFAWRVKVLTGKKWLWVILNVASFISFLCGLGTTIGCVIVKEFDKFQSFQSVVIVWLTTSAATDILIAIILVVQLSRRRNGIADTEDLITRLVRFTIQTGLVTSLWAITDLIVFLTLTNNLHLIFNLALSKLYSGACLSSLNSRTKWVNASEESRPHQFISTARSGAIAGGINVVTTSTVHHDPNEFELESYSKAKNSKKIGMSLPRRSSRAHATPLDVHSALETPQKVISLTDDDASMYEKPQQDIEAGQPVDITSRAIISPNATSVVQSDLD